MRAALAMRDGLQHRVFSADALAELQRCFEIDVTSTITSFTGVDPAELARIELLVTGWEAPWIGARELDMMPRLRAVVHAAGTVKPLLDPVAWDRGIRVSTAALANAHPVAEFALAMILLAAKDVFWIARDYSRRADRVDHIADNPSIGAYGAVVGIVGASRVGRRVLELLQPFDFEVLLYDPYLSDDEAARWSARRCGLEELVRSSGIVSLHAPSLPQTHHMIDRGMLALMPGGATLVNTARGDLVEQDALVEELQSGRLRAILDVTDPEPLPAGHALWTLPNAFLTPHLSGSQGNELHRLGRSALDEALRVLAGDDLLHGVSAADLARMA